MIIVPVIFCSKTRRDCNFHRRVTLMFSILPAIRKTQRISLVRLAFIAAVIWTSCIASYPLHAGSGQVRKGVTPTQATVPVRIPRIDRAPRLEEFLDMRVSPTWDGKLAKVTGFVQRSPENGRPATEATDVYLGYDKRALHVVFVAHDRNAKAIRSRLERRESIFDRNQTTIAADEDYVGIYLDTFRDRRHAYEFACNPLGIQNDALYSEDSDSADDAFDAVWSSHGKLTSGGYVVVMSLPFKSLRFSHQESQTWNIALSRNIGHRLEEAWWPTISSARRGILSQAAAASGFENISPGRNFQIVPYITSRTYQLVDPRDPQNPAYAGRDAEVTAGFDAKAILKDSLVLDLTARPDFSQVESDEPQITTNQRYELFYPEKRPFFTENSSYFDVPMVVPNQHFLFTRRISHPDFGARLTGKLGHYSVGALFADDRSPGESVPPSDRLAGKRAYFDVFRMTRDLPSHSNIGASYAERRFQQSYSRMADLDTTFGIGSTWKGTLMGEYNWNRSLDGSSHAGGTLDTTLTRVSRGFNYIGYFLNRAPGFQPELSFYNHSNWRELGQTFAYQFWPDDPWITRIWAEVYAARNWHYNGDLNWEGVKPMVKVDVKHNTTLTSYLWAWHDAFGHQDFTILNKVVKFPLVPAYGLRITSTQARFLTLQLAGEWGTRSNVTPPTGHAPTQARYQQVRAEVSLLTSKGLNITNTYLFDHNASLTDGRAIYNLHVARSKWNWQINRELSLRFIAQYNVVLANPLLTAGPTARSLDGDFLITYYVHPGTACYIGYNSNLSKPGPAIGRNTPDEFVNDGKQFFVKVSYMLHF